MPAAGDTTGPSAHWADRPICAVVYNSPLKLFQWWAENSENVKSVDLCALTANCEGNYFSDLGTVI